MPLLSRRRQVASDSTEDLRSLEFPETARDLLLHFVHPNILLALIVRERNFQVLHESQDITLKIPKTIEQILAFRLLGSASGSAKEFRILCMKTEAGAEPFFVGLQKLPPTRTRELRSPLVLRPLHSLMNLQKKLSHLSRPAFADHFLEELQLPQNMGIAECMEAVLESKIRLPMIMDGDSVKVREDPEILHGLSPSLGMDPEKSELAR